jgi:hypothetical protein
MIERQDHRVLLGSVADEPESLAPIPLRISNRTSTPADSRPHNSNTSLSVSHTRIPLTCLLSFPRPSTQLDQAAVLVFAERGGPVFHVSRLALKGNGYASSLTGRRWKYNGLRRSLGIRISVPARKFMTHRALHKVPGEGHKPLGNPHIRA